MAIETAGERRIGRIPVRNLWLLMLYASELTRTKGVFDSALEDDVDDLPELVARLLANSVERRLRRNLTYGYLNRAAVQRRVRGRIDILNTESRQLFSRGEVYCRFEELTSNTPRNRLVRAALDLAARLVGNDGLAQRCRALAFCLCRAGVVGGCPSRAEMANDQLSRNDAEDRFMIALARLIFDMALPTEEAGMAALPAPDREEIWVRRLFEKAVLGFARVELQPLGWSVRGGVPLDWQVSSSSSGLATLLPRMVTDIVLDSPGNSRVVIDTKFTSIIAKGRFGDTRLKSGYLYQMYSYLRSQEGRDPTWKGTAGMFLHPAVDGTVFEHAVIDEHRITFATIDLGGSSASIRNELRNVFLGLEQRFVEGLRSQIIKL